MEGDGDISGGKNRIGIRFSTSQNEEIIHILLKKLHISFWEDYHKVREGGNGISLSFNLIEIIKNIDFIVDDIFKYYPKRRNKFIRRLFQTSTIQSILGNKEIKSNYVAKIIKENNFMSEKIIKNLKKIEKDKII